MSTGTKRLLGFVCLLAAAALFVLNLKRVANLGSYWVALPLLLVGIVLIASSRRRD